MTTIHIKNDKGEVLVIGREAKNVIIYPDGDKVTGAYVSIQFGVNDYKEIYEKPVAIGIDIMLTTGEKTKRL